MPLYLKLRKEAGELHAKAKELQDKADEENRKLTQEEGEQFDAFMADAREKLDEANRREQIEQMEATTSSVGAGDDLTQDSGGIAGVAVSTAVQGTDQAENDPTAGLGAAVSATAIDHEEMGRRGFAYMGEFAQRVYHACTPGNVADKRLIPLMAVTGGSQGVGSDGGFLVPPTFGEMIWDGLRTDPMDLVSRGDQFTVTGESLTFPANAETDRSSGIVYGGVQAFWISEAAKITATKPTFRKIRLEPQELAVLIFETDKLIRNSPLALEQFLGRAAGAGIGFNVNDAIIRGDGSGKPLGLLNSSSLISVAKESGQAADTIVFENIVKMYSRLHARRRVNAVWLINQDIEPQLFGIIDPSNNVPVFLPPGGLSAAPFGMLLGRPVLPLEHASTLGDVGDIIFVDLSAYAVGLRGGAAAGIRPAVSIHLRFDFAETAFRFMFEIDGKPWLLSAQTPAQGANTLSTHVTLAARA